MRLIFLVFILCLISIAIGLARLHSTIGRDNLAESQLRASPEDGDPLIGGVAQIDNQYQSPELFGRPNGDFAETSVAPQSSAPKLIGSIQVDGQRWEIRQTDSGNTSILPPSETAETAVSKLISNGVTTSKPDSFVPGILVGPNVAINRDMIVPDVFDSSAPPRPNTIFLRFVVPACAAC